MRKTSIKLIYQGTDISENIASYLKDISFIDHSGSKADDLQITVDNRDKRWTNSWFPLKGATLIPEIICDNWFSDGKQAKLSPGTFTVDEMRTTAPPSEFIIKAITTSTSKAFRRQGKTKAWEKINLRQIALEITNSYNMKLFYDGDIIDFVRIDQREESDLRFLKRLCNENGMNIKVANDKVIVYSGKNYDERISSFTFSPDDGWVTSYNISTNSVDVYKACTVKYWDSDDNRELLYTFTPSNTLLSGQVLTFNTRVESLQAAERRARAALRRKNKQEIEGTMAFMGHPGLLAGLNIDLTGLGIFNGKYFIDEARHRVDVVSGYKTTLKIRKVLNY
jgi:phage protein D